MARRVRLNIVINCRMASTAKVATGLVAPDEERMREIFQFTARTLETAHPVPFGALIVKEIAQWRDLGQSAKITLD